MNPAKRRAMFTRWRALDPHPDTELCYRTPFELLVSVVLSAQATDKSVNKATARLFPVTNTPAAMVQLGVDGLIPYINSIGLFRGKAKNVVALAEILLREHELKTEEGRLAALEARLIEKDKALIERDQTLKDRAKRITTIANE